MAKSLFRVKNITLSFGLLCSWALYATYSRRQRGHILPFHSFCRLEHRMGEDGKVHGLEPRCEFKTFSSDMLTTIKVFPVCFRIIVGSKVISEGREGEKGADA